MKFSVLVLLMIFFIGCAENVTVESDNAAVEETVSQEAPLVNEAKTTIVEQKIENDNGNIDLVAISQANEKVISDGRWFLAVSNNTGGYTEYYDKNGNLLGRKN